MAKRRPQRRRQWRLTYADEYWRKLARRTRSLTRDMEIVLHPESDPVARYYDHETGRPAMIRQLEEHLEAARQMLTAISPAPPDVDEAEIVIDAEYRVV